MSVGTNNLLDFIKEAFGGKSDENQIEAKRTPSLTRRAIEELREMEQWKISIL